MRGVLLFLLSVGCGSPESTVRATGAPEVSLSDLPIGVDDSGARSDDALAVRELLDGLRSPEQVFRQIAWSGGFPVEDAQAGTYLFVHWHRGGSWSLAGDFNDWTPQPMNRRNDLWWLEVPVSQARGATYKFVDRGTTWIADPWARSFTYDGFGEISYVRPPLGTHRLDRWPAVGAAGLAPRDVRVYVPPGAGPWPVLTMHDGNNLFDPDAMWGGWRLQDALEGVDPVLVVGIDNTLDRMEEYTHVADDIGWGEPLGGEGDAYAAFVHESLLPRLEARYPTTSLRGVMGSSLGGLISLHIGQRYPGEYDFVGSLSGTLGWGRYADMGPAMEQLYLDSGADAVLYLDSGGSPGADGACRDLDGDGYPEDDPDDSDNYCVTRQFVDAMASHGYTWNEDLFHWHEPFAPHNEAAWAERVHLPLGIFTALDD